jgi:hypothetical protein
VTVWRKASILLHRNTSILYSFCASTPTAAPTQACLLGWSAAPAQACLLGGSASSHELESARRATASLDRLAAKRPVRCRQASHALPPRRHVSCRQSVTCVAPRRFHLDSKGTSLALFLYFSFNTVCVLCPHTSYLAPTRQPSAVLLARALAV